MGSGPLAYTVVETIWIPKILAVIGIVLSTSTRVMWTTLVAPISQPILVIMIAPNTLLLVSNHFVRERVADDDVIVCYPT